MDKKMSAEGESATGGKKKILLTLAVFILVAGVGIYLKTQAGTGDNTSGWLWGGSEDANIGGVMGSIDGNETGVGKISMNSTNCDADGNGISDIDPLVNPDCPALGSAVASYGVNIPEGGGAVTGYAWSENMGYIDFEPQNHCGAAYSAASCTDPDGGSGGVNYDNGTGNLTGWARFVEIAKESASGNSGDWTGWIKIDGSNTITQNTCNDGPKAGQACSADADCLETANCTALSPITVSGNVTTNSDSVDVIFIGSGNDINISGTNGTNYGSLSISSASVSGKVTTNSDSVDVIFIGSGNDINISGTNGTNYGSLSISGASVSGKVTTQSSGADIRLRGNGNKIEIWKYDLSLHYGDITLSSPAYTCPLSGGSACSGSPSTCSLTHTCAATTSNITYGVTINTNPTSPDYNKLSGYAWSDELGWIDFSKASVAVPNILKICVNSCDSGILIANSSSRTMTMGDSLNLKACFNTSASCDTATGDVTASASATWNENNTPNDAVSLSGTDPKILTANSQGSEGISASYNSQTSSFTVTVVPLCVCNTGCEANTCTGTNCNDSCGNSVCEGTKKCNANWREVAP